MSEIPNVRSDPFGWKDTLGVIDPGGAPVGGWCGHPFIDQYTQQLLWCLDSLKRPPKKILEVGLGHGVSTCVWLTCTTAPVTTIDICPGGWGGGIGGRIVSQLPQELQDRWTFLLGKGDEVALALKEEFDFIFLDSSHQYRDTLRELDVLWNRLEIGGVLTGHDSGEAAVGVEGCQVRRAAMEFCQGYGFEFEEDQAIHRVGVFSIRRTR
jgi:hypothetical protein